MSGVMRGMDALLSALVAALLAEIGDKTQLVALALAARFAHDRAVLGGIALAAAVNASIAAAGGAWIGPMMTREAATLLLAIALLFTGAGAFWRRQAPSVERWRGGAFVASLAAFGLAEFGDKTQFMTFAIAARSEAPVLAGLGGALGVIVSNAFAIGIGAGIAQLARPARWAIGALFVLLGLAAALAALRLI